VRRDRRPREVQGAFSPEGPADRCDSERPDQDATSVVPSPRPHHDAVPGHGPDLLDIGNDLEHGGDGLGISHGGGSGLT